MQEDITKKEDQEVAVNTETNPDDTNQNPENPDASRKEIMLYAFGNIEGAAANNFFMILQQIMIIAMSISPLFIGLIIGIKTLWDGITDPIMAYITDNTKSRWGRRKPYILVGGILRIALLSAIIWFFPIGDKLRTNAELDNQKAKDGTIELCKSIEKDLSSDRNKKPDGFFSSIKSYVFINWLNIQTPRDQAISTAKDYSKRFNNPEVKKLMTELIADLEEPGENLSEINKAKKIRKIVDDIKTEETIILVANKLSEKIAPEFTNSTDVEVLHVKAKEIATELIPIFETNKQGKTLAYELKDRENQKLAVQKANELLKDQKNLSVKDFSDKFICVLEKDLIFRQAKQATVKKAQKVFQNLSAEFATQDEKKSAIKSSKKLSEQISAELKLQKAKPLALQKARTLTAVISKPADETDKIIADAKSQVKELIEEIKERKIRKKKGALAKIKEGFNAFMDPFNADQRKIIIYVLFAFLLFTTFTTINSVPYYALGIEMCSSYDGRTKLVTWRAITFQIAGLVTPWIPVFCFGLWFIDAMEGLKYLAVITAAIGIPSTIIMCIFTKERKQVTSQKKTIEMGILKSIFITMKNVHFLKVFALYWFIGLNGALFGALGFYLNVYWVKKSAVAGATLGASVGMLAWVLALASLPLIQWSCKKFQKHNVLRFAIIWMSIGTVLKWWCINPKYPYFQFVLPFFFSIGIVCTYTVLSTMLADITDVDELHTGQRREGMFGAVNAFLMKMVGSLTPVLAAAILVFSGFDADLEFMQKASTIYNLRLLNSFVPGVMLLLGLLVLWRYPITRERLKEIQAEIRAKR